MATVQFFGGEGPFPRKLQVQLQLHGEKEEGYKTIKRVQHSLEIIEEVYVRTMHSSKQEENSGCRKLFPLKGKK